MFYFHHSIVFILIVYYLYQVGWHIFRGMYRKKNKEVKELPFCKECNMCKDEKVNKCCRCYYMSIDDWNGWKRICLIHQDYCNDIDVTDCEDWKEYKKVNI